jgi:hypothetical protein
MVISVLVVASMGIAIIWHYDKVCLLFSRLMVCEVQAEQ